MPNFSKCINLYSHLHYVNFHCFTYNQHLILSIFKVVGILLCVCNSSALWFNLHFAVTNEIEHIFICLLLFGYSPLWADYANVLPIFSIELYDVFLLFGYKSFVIDVINMFSHSVTCLFTFLMLLFNNKQFQILRKTKISVLSFMMKVFSVLCKKFFSF